MQFHLLGNEFHKLLMHGIKLQSNGEITITRAKAIYYI